MTSSATFPSSSMSAAEASLSVSVALQSPTIGKMSKLSKHHTAVRRHLMIESVQCVDIDTEQQDGVAKNDSQCTLLVNTAWLNGQSHASTAAQRRVKEQQEIESGRGSGGGGGGGDDDMDSDASDADATPAYTITRPLTDIIDLSDRLVASFDTLLSTKRGGPSALSNNPALFNKRGRLRDVRSRKQSSASARHIFDSIIRRTPSKSERGGNGSMSRVIRQRAAVDEFFQRALDVGGEVVASSRAMQDFFLQDTPEETENLRPLALSSASRDGEVYVEPLASTLSVTRESNTLLHDIKAMLTFQDGAGIEVRKKESIRPADDANDDPMADITFTRQMHVPAPSRRMSMLAPGKRLQKSGLMSKLLESSGEFKKAVKLKERLNDTASWRAHHAAQSPAISLTLPALVKEKEVQKQDRSHRKSSSVSDTHERVYFGDASIAQTTSLRQHGGGKGSGASSDPGPTTPSSIMQHDSTSPWHTFQENLTALDWLSVDSSRCTSIISVESDILEQVDSECSSDQVRMSKPVEDKQALSVPRSANLRRVSSMTSIHCDGQGHALLASRRFDHVAQGKMQFQHPAPSGDILIVKEGEGNSSVALFEVVHCPERPGHRGARLTASIVPRSEGQTSAPCRLVGSRVSSIYVDGSPSPALQKANDSAPSASQDSCIDPLN